MRDVDLSARDVEFFAGLVTEMKGETVPLGSNYLNYTTREPLGVIARIIAYNHLLMFATMRHVASRLDTSGSIRQVPISWVCRSADTSNLASAGKKALRNFLPALR